MRAKLQCVMDLQQNSVGSLVSRTILEAWCVPTAQYLLSLNQPLVLVGHWAARNVS